MLCNLPRLWNVEGLLGVFQIVNKYLEKKVKKKMNKPLTFIFFWQV